MSEVKIPAELRTEFGKGPARRIRRADRVPAVLYGHGKDPVHISLPGHDTMLALRTANALLNLDIDGGGTELAIPKHVQRDPVKGFIEHVDLLAVRRGEKVIVDVPVLVQGEPAPGALVTHEHSTLRVESEATHIPERLEVSIEGLEPGSQVQAGAVQLPTGVVLQMEPDALVVSISAAPSPEELEAELAAAEADAGIERDAPKAETADGGDAAEGGEAGEPGDAAGEGERSEG